MNIAIRPKTQTPLKKLKRQTSRLQTAGRKLAESKVSALTVSVLTLAVQTGLIFGLSSTTSWANSTAQIQQQSYQIDSGSLDTVLNRFALQAKIDVAIDGRLTAGKQSQGLHGQYTVSQGLSQILNNTGLTALQQDGVYLIKAHEANTSNHANQVASTSADLATAAVPSSTVIKLAPIIVTATRSEKSIAEIAGSVQQIDQQQIVQQAAAGRKVTDVLAQLIPSLAPSSGTTSNYGQSMRGRQVLVMIDGVSMNSSRDVSRQLNSISPSLIERIEVISGATSIYGSGATGGIINIITKRADADKPVSFETKVGVSASSEFEKDSLNYELGQTASFTKDHLNGFLGLNFTSRGGRFDGQDQRIPVEPYQTDRSDTTTVDVNGRLNIDLNDEQSVSLGVQYYKDQQDTDYAPDYSAGFQTAPSFKAVKGLQLDDQPFTERYLFNSQYQHQDFFGQILNLEAYYRKEKARFFPVYAGTAFASQSQADIDVAGFRSTLQKNLSVADRELKLTYGLDYDHEKDHQYYELLNVTNLGLVYTPTGKSFGAGPDTVIQNIGAFLQSDLALTDKLNLQGGLRYQFIQADTDAYIPARQAQRAAQGLAADLSVAPADSTHDDKVLFNLGAVYALTDEQQVFANFSQGFSYPDVQRMFRDVAVNSVSTANITPITVNSYELGWRLQGDNSLDLAVTGFYNTSDKVVQFNADRSASVANTDQRVYGAELSASYPILDDFKIGGSYALTRGQYRDAANAWRELNAYQISPAKGTLFAEWANEEGYGVRAQVLAVKGTDRAANDDQRAITDNNVFPNTAAKISGYSTMDVLVHAPLYAGRIDFGVYNLWNKQYRSVYSQQSAVTFAPISSVPAEGRTYALSYTIQY